MFHITSQKAQTAPVATSSVPGRLAGSLAFRIQMRPAISAETTQASSGTMTWSIIGAAPHR